MSSTYTISIHNDNGHRAHTAIFIAPPPFSEGPKPLMTVWSHMYSPNNSYFELQAGRDWYAWTGIVPDGPSPGDMVRTIVSATAKLGREGFPGSTFKHKIHSDSPDLFVASPGAPPGAFEIQTGGDIPEPNERFLIGVAKKNGLRGIAPFAVATAINNSKIAITPKMKFFITDQKLEVGEIVEYDTVVQNAAVVDFDSGEGMGSTEAKAVNTNGRWEVRYLEPVPQPPSSGGKPSS